MFNSHLTLTYEPLSPEIGEENLSPLRPFVAGFWSSFAIELAQFWHSANLDKFNTHKKHETPSADFSVCPHGVIFKIVGCYAFSTASLRLAQNKHMRKFTQKFLQLNGQRE